MDERVQLEREVEAPVFFAATMARDDDELRARIYPFVSSDPSAALEVGPALVESPDSDRREISIRMIGMAAELDRTEFQERALLTLRGALDPGHLAGQNLWAIVALSHLCEETSHDAILANARHPDPDVSEVVAAALPLVGLEEPTLATLRDLSRDANGEVRNWLTVSLGEPSEADDDAMREALPAGVEDSYETLVEGIVGLARRQALATLLPSDYQNSTRGGPLRDLHLDLSAGAEFINFKGMERDEYDEKAAERMWRRRLLPLGARAEPWPSSGVLAPASHICLQ
jgi:hypothetical protein